MLVRAFEFRAEKLTQALIRWKANQSEDCGISSQVCTGFNRMCGWLFIFSCDLHCKASHSTLHCDVAGLSVT